MVKVRPFRAVRPTKDLAAKIASLPYDVLSSEEARELGNNNPYSFLHIDKAEIDLDKKISPYDKKVYKQARENLQTFIKKEWLMQDTAPGFYLYQLIMNGRSQTGIVAVTSIDDYAAGNIKKHEFTREEKELDRINHVDTCDANTSPIFLTYRGKENLNRLIASYVVANQPEYDFTSFHDVTHRVWHIDDPILVEEIASTFDAIPTLYIADGHHRTESAVKVGQKRRENIVNAVPEAEFNFFLAVLFPEEELEILDYNRVVNVPINNNYLEQLANSFDIEKVGAIPYKPVKAKEIGMYLKGLWYKLVAKEAIIPKDVIGQLDVSLLQDQVLTPLFAIEDIRRDQRIDFVGGIRGLEELVHLVDSGFYTIAFAMYPTTMSDLLNVADAGEIMPPKSTWFEPKLLSGLFIHLLESKS